MFQAQSTIISHTTNLSVIVDSVAFIVASTTYT